MQRQPAHVRGAAAVDAPWFGHLLNQTAAYIRSRTTTALGPLGISPPMLRALEAIAVDPPLTQVQLGSRVNMDRTTVVHVVDRFEALGYAERTRSPTDRRSQELTLTEAGGAALRKARELARDVEASVLAPLSSGDRHTLIRLLQAIHRPINCPEGTP